MTKAVRWQSVAITKHEEVRYVLKTTVKAFLTILILAAISFHWLTHYRNTAFIGVQLLIYLLIYFGALRLTYYAVAKIEERRKNR